MRIGEVRSRNDAVWNALWSVGIRITIKVPQRITATRVGKGSLRCWVKVLG